MQIVNFIRRCKRKTGSDRFETLHGADNNATLCGKELNEMWFIESSAGLTEEDITCKQCLKVMNNE